MEGNSKTNPSGCMIVSLLTYLSSCAIKERNHSQE